jgi:hypothetical protein
MSFDIRVPSPFPPSVVFHGEKFHMAFRTPNSDIMYGVSDDGQTWKDFVGIEETTGGVPCIVIAENRTAIVFPARHEAGIIRYTIRDERSGRWTHSRVVGDPVADQFICAVGKPTGEILVYFRPPNSDRLHGFSFSINK